MQGLFRSVMRLAKCQRGALPSIEFILLLFPVFIVTMSLIQQILIAQAVVTTEYAAYAAGRSALVHSCRPVPIMAPGESPIGTAKAIWGALNCDEPTTEDGSVPWETAARMALLPIAPSSLFSQERQGNCRYPEAAVEFIVRGPVGETLRDAVEQKACYVFEGANVSVDLDWVWTEAQVTLVQTLPPIRAEVTYHMSIYGPVAGLFSQGRRDDGTHFRIIKAEATLL
ncbi:TadE/TadG family type IV pilus assembly protein [Loktanella sp. DSM 29012]|uniref:TadE/TadG family type IV pilus assembly protein n=1 Tax=Loktanella sp. DSM 29012 TaxID=1881056 RepID=UPI0015A6A39C|nr:hypothetical protein [Loktanella sp. DSM 29012]